MTDLIIPLKKITEAHKDISGGKAWALSRLLQHGIHVPEGLCITTHAYRTFVNETGLDNRILMEMNRKSFNEMRWEEIWDLSLRIRNYFLSTSIPPWIRKTLKEDLKKRFSNVPVVVRSSSCSEDSAETSFAGLHESFVNVTGEESILQSIKLVWASLWSDTALLYRRELALDVKKSAMAVVIQELAEGQRSGVAFSINPLKKNESIVESVWGLNQGLVDGSVEPDRWIISRENGEILSHKEPSLRDITIVAAEKGTASMKSKNGEIKKPPLNRDEVKDVFLLSQKSEEYFGSPQDVEWTFRNNDLFLLQSRPITSISGEDDNRQKYLSLKVSFDELKRLRFKIEQELLPEMDREADNMTTLDIQDLDDKDLAVEIRKRMDILDKWNLTYTRDFIPFAHGTRLFGRFYNDTMSPDDPFEFVLLLKGTEMKSLKRNNALLGLARRLKDDPELRGKLEMGQEIPSELKEQFNSFARDFSLSSGETLESSKKRAARFILEMSALSEQPLRGTSSNSDLYNSFISHFQDDGERSLALEYLDLGRASWKLRDDDNIYLAAIENEVNRAILEGKKRIDWIRSMPSSELTGEDVSICLENHNYQPVNRSSVSPLDNSSKRSSAAFFRQATGQPASPGTGTGKARVIRNKGDLMAFKKDEIIVCDAIEPDMTFIVPLAAGIVERRGGMLIHGAIIAREYGIPCVTGVPGAAEIIKEGSTVTVDGYLGIVIVEN